MKYLNISTTDIPYWWLFVASGTGSVSQQGFNFNDHMQQLVECYLLLHTVFPPQNS